MSDGLRTAIVRITQVGWYRTDVPVAHVLYRSPDRGDHTVGLGRQCQRDDGLSERDLRFWPPDELNGLCRGDRRWQRPRLGETDVFAGQNDQPPGKEPWVLSGFGHTCQVVQGGVGVAAAD